MSKAQVFRKSEGRDIRIAKISTAKEAIGTIGKGTDTYILTFGQFSLVDALVAILDQTGPATVDISTWTAADAHLQRTMELMDTKMITKLRMIVDRSFEGRQPEYCYHMRKLFGNNCLRAIRSHSKFMVIRSETHNVVVRTSMNLNENPRLENIEVSESTTFADFMTSVVDAIFAEVSEGENQSILPELPTLPDDYPFREVAAGHIDRGTLHEPATSHTLKAL